MNYEIIIGTKFKKQFKALSKKYKSLKEDFVSLIETIQQNPKKGVD